MTQRKQSKHSKKSRSPRLAFSSLPVGLALLVLLSGGYLLLAHPRDLGPSGGQAGYNLYLVGVCSNNPSQTCNPAEPAEEDACGPAPAFCMDTYGRCSGDGKICHPSSQDAATTCGVDEACQGVCRQSKAACDSLDPLLSCLTGDECLLFNTLADLDNCPGGPNGPTCRDEFDVQVSCYNPQQADDNMDLVGNICDACNDSGAFGVFSLADVSDWGKVCLNDPVGVQAGDSARFNERRACRFAEDCPVLGALRCSDP